VQTATASADHLANRLIDFDMPDGKVAFANIYEPDEDIDGRLSYGVAIPVELIDAELLQHLHISRSERVRARSGRRPQVKPVLTTFEIPADLKIDDPAIAHSMATTQARLAEISPGIRLEFATEPVDILVRGLDRLHAQNLPLNTIFAGRRLIAHTMVAVKGVNFEEGPRRGPAKPDACLWLQSVTIYV